MLRSMTGFGCAEGREKRFTVRVEVRSLNNRHLKVVSRLPEAFQAREADIERRVRERLSRGTVYVTIALESPSGDPGYQVDQQAVAYYARIVGELARSLANTRPLSPLDLLNLPGCLRRREDDPEVQAAAWRAAEGALEEALDRLAAMRAEEGGRLWQDMVGHTRDILARLDALEARVPQVVRDYAARLRGRVDRLLEGRGVALSEPDLNRDLALFAERSDISEEISRLRSHLVHFQNIPSESPDEPCGRKIEFLVQEMLREANTMASKANDAEIVHEAVEIKLAIDRIREQCLNVE